MKCKFRTTLSETSVIADREADRECHSSADLYIRRCGGEESEDPLYPTGL